MRVVCRGVPYPGPDAHVLLRDGVREPRGRHLDQGAAARSAASAGFRPARPGGVRSARCAPPPAQGFRVIAASSTAGLTDLVVFWVFAPIAVGAAVAMVFARKAVHSALFLIVNFFCLAVFFLVLGSPFLFAVQIVVYAGAIMVLFLFVIMLLGVTREESLVERVRGQRPLAILLGLGLIAEVALAVRYGVGISTHAA